jgi:hypothetical protein
MTVDPKTLWKEQDVSVATLSPADLEARFRAQRSALRRRNLVEYVAGAIVIAVFLGYAAVLPGALVKAGSVLTAAGAAFVLWQLHRRASVAAIPDDAAADALRAAQVRELERQRDALRSVALWYLAPFLPGLILFFVGVHLAAPDAQPLALAVPLGGMAGLFGLIWAANLIAARALDRQIRNLVRDGDDQ